MKFETKIQKLGIDQEEVKSIIANCFCGEVNGAYFIDLTKEKKEFIMEVVGNYLDDDSEEFEGWTDIKRISTFCKVFGITEDEIPDYYRLGFNEGGCDIAYELESNPNVILVLTDDERYHNSFIQYSPSQEEIEQYTKELEELEKEYIRLGELKPVKEPLTIFDEPATKVNCEIHIRRKGAKYQCRYHDIQKLTQDEIEFINSRNTSQNIIKKLEILRYAEIGDDMSADEQEWYSFGRGSNILVINELIDELREIEKENGKISISKDWKHYITLEVREDVTSSSSSETIENEVENMATEEKWVNFKIVSKNDERIYIAGQFNLNSYDEDTDMGDWEYEQNDGTYSSHIPSYWKVDGENLSFEFDNFIGKIDWGMFRQWLMDCRNESKTIDCGDYILHINGGTCTNSENYIISMEI